MSGPVEQTCLCGNVTVLVQPGTDLSGLRCWLCPPTRPVLSLVPGTPVVDEDGTVGIVRDSKLTDVFEWNSRDGVVYDKSEDDR